MSKENSVVLNSGELAPLKKRIRSHSLSLEGESSERVAGHSDDVIDFSADFPKQGLGMEEQVSLRCDRFLSTIEKYIRQSLNKSSEERLKREYPDFSEDKIKVCFRIRFLDENHSVKSSDFQKDIYRGMRDRIVRATGSHHKVWLLPKNHLVIKVSYSLLKFSASLQILNEIRKDFNRGLCKKAYNDLKELVSFHKVKKVLLPDDWLAVESKHMSDAIKKVHEHLQKRVDYYNKRSARHARIVHDEWSSRKSVKLKLISKASSFSISSDLPRITLITQSDLPHNCSSDALVDDYLRDRLTTDGRLLLDCNNVRKDAEKVCRGFDSDYDISIADGYESDESETVKRDFCQNDAEFVNEWVKEYFIDWLRYLPASMSRVRLMLSLMRYAAKGDHGMARTAKLPKALIEKACSLEHHEMMGCFVNKNPTKEDSPASYFELSGLWKKEVSDTLVPLMADPVLQ